MHLPGLLHFVFLQIDDFILIFKNDHYFSITCSVILQSEIRHSVWRHYNLDDIQPDDITILTTFSLTTLQSWQHSVWRHYNLDDIQPDDITILATLILHDITILTTFSLTTLQSWQHSVWRHSVWRHSVWRHSVWRHYNLGNINFARQYNLRHTAPICRITLH